jgi:TolB protein
MVDGDTSYVHETAPISAPSRRGRRTLLVLVAIATVAAVVAAVALGGGHGPRPQRIVLVDPDGALAVLDPVSGSRTAYPIADTTFQFPAWSPDGTRFAAIGTSGAGSTVTVFDGTDGAPTTGTAVYASTDAPPFYLYWAPDSRSITFLTSQGSDIALRTVPPAASYPATVLATGSPLYWAWETGPRLLVHSGGSSPSALFAEVPTDGSTAHGPILDAQREGPGDFRAPSVSADGRSIAYEVRKADGSSAVVSSLIDGSARQEAKVLGPAAMSFSPVGDDLAFIGAAAFQDVQPIPLGPVRILDRASGATRTVASGEAVVCFWSPDGRTLAVLLVPPGSGTNAGVPSPARRASIAHGGPAGASPAADRPGFELRLEFVDVASGTARVTTTVRVTSLFVNELLPYFDQYALSHRLWAPDGSSLLLPLVGDDDKDQLALVPADGTPSRILGPGSVGAWSP